MSQHPQLNVRVDESFLARLDEWRRQQADLPGRPEAIRRLVDAALTRARIPSAVSYKRKSGGRSG